MTDLQQSPFVALLGSLENFPRECEEDLAAGLDEDTSPETLSILLQASRAARAELLAWERGLEQELIARAGAKRFVVPGLGEVEIHKSTKRTEWDNEGLTRVLVARSLDERKVDEQTGEYEPAWGAVARVLMDCARPTWRVTALRAHGLQVDEWCHEESDGWSIQLPRRQT